MAAPPEDWFAGIGAHGFRAAQTALLAALVTEDPLLLIGRCGTGKTYLLNSISEALGLEHRHYNASLIAFDDLVGFPCPDEARESVHFLQTPATVWGAESVLVDEISRCKPEHQNRLFSLVHERRVQGIALHKLRYRWAAMNPPSADQCGPDDYTGSEALDNALADRFAILVEVGDWDALSEAQQRAIADPSGEGRLADDGGRLRAAVARWRGEFEAAIEACPPAIVEYARLVAGELGHAGLRISPRRARFIARSLLAASIVEGEAREDAFRCVLGWSLPQRAGMQRIEESRVSAAHRLAWDAAFAGGEQLWLNNFHLRRNLPAKLRFLRATCPDPDIGTLAIEQLLANEPRERSAAFALATHGAALRGELPLSAQGSADIARAVAPLLDLSGEINWFVPTSAQDTPHPDLVRLSVVLDAIEPGPRRERARQLFYWCIVNSVKLPKPAELEAELHAMVCELAEGGA